MHGGVILNMTIPHREIPETFAAETEVCEVEEAYTALLKLAR
jgi:hypothetical protein